MIPQAFERLALGHRLHGLTLAKAALDDAALLLVKVHKFGDSHFSAARVAHVGWIVAVSGLAQDLLCLTTSLLWCNGAVGADCHIAARRPAATPYAVADEERLLASLLYPQAEACQS